jgi:hypothetical protein
MKVDGKQSFSCHLICCSAYSSIVKMEAVCSSETPVDFQRTTRRYIPEDSTLHIHRCEDLKSYIMFGLFLQSNSNYMQTRELKLVGEISRRVSMVPKARYSQ